MLLLPFSIGTAAYVVDAAEVKGVLPLLQLESLHCSPAYVAGVANYYGSPLTVIDLVYLLTTKRHEKCFTSRILLLEYTCKGGEYLRLGVIVEKLTETLKADPDKVRSEVIHDSSAGFMGQMYWNGEQMVQQVILHNLFTSELQEWINRVVQGQD